MLYTEVTKYTAGNLNLKIIVKETRDSTLTLPLTLYDTLDQSLSLSGPWKTASEDILKKSMDRSAFWYIGGNAYQSIYIFTRKAKQK